MNKRELFRLKDIDYQRETSGFEKILGKYQAIEIIRLAKGPKLLDLGCGDGSITNELSKQSDEVVGVDGSKKNIEYARERVGRNVRLYHSLIEDFDPKGEKYDTIILTNVLEHVEDSIKVLSNVKNWLEKDGFVVIVVPNALSFNRRLGVIMGLIKDPYELSTIDIQSGHRRFYDRKTLQQHIEDSGLEVESMGGIFLKPLSNKQMESWSEALCDALYEIGKELPTYCASIYARCVNKKLNKQVIGVIF